MVIDSRFVIAVQDLQRSADYYRTVLGFEIKEIGDDGWRAFVSGKVCIMAGECADAMSASQLGDHSYFAYLVLDQIEDYFTQVQAAGAEIIKPLRDEPWGMREFAVRTVDGHRMMFGQEL
ncbi:VOC family protein [Marinobacterium jannaschii]|uniref:VOC family protein n=1 Tax=Marinobacterium jannaschii TaxID=64970 RepID=UPI00048045EE|nr:VOC family protein [Marinobacterium jannaschii]